MENFRRVFTILLFMLIVFPPVLFAGTSGKIVGQIKDKATNEGLPGVNVIVQEYKDGKVQSTSMGAPTDFDGNFMILNVPPGNYSVKASMIGYKIVTQTDIVVSIDLTTRVDFDMEETTMEGEEVTVVAKRKIVRKDLTARTAVVSAEEISKAPVEEIEDVLATQAGVTKGSGGEIHIRGGRTGEVAYWIDGVSVTDSYSGNIAVEVENSAVKEMQVVSGAFNAEFGQAMSGIINIATKDGGTNYHGSLSAYFGDYISNHGYDDFIEDDAGSDPDKVFMNIGDVNPTSIMNYQFSLDGPILSDKVAFYLTGRYFDTSNQHYGKRIFNPEDASTVVNDPITGQPVWVIAASGDSEYVALNPYKKYSGQAKLSFKFIESMKLSFNTLWSKAEYENFEWELKYNPDGNLQRFEDGLTGIFKLTHTLSPKTYYDLSGTFTQFKYQHYAHENLDDYHIHPDLWDNRPSYTYRTGGEDMNRFERETKSKIIKLDATSQVTQHHQLKSGFELRFHNMFLDDAQVVPSYDQFGEIVPFDPIILDITATSHDRYRHKPKEFSVYLQDKIEFEDIIINAGVRYDYFDPDGKILSDPTDPNVYYPVRMENQERSLEDRLSYWYKDAKTTSQVSPRVGIAYPMTQGGVIHFSYGHFFQIPKFEYLYMNPEFEILSGGRPVNTQVGNANLEPEKTVSYEIGLQQALTEDMGIAADIYFRDIRNLVSSDKIVETFDVNKYAQYVNRDYANIRGIALSLTKRYSNRFSASVDYTYQIAEGNASDPNDAYNDVRDNNQPEKKLVALGWDQRHLLNVVLTFSEPDNWSFSMLSTLGSGFPYTPSTTKVGAFSENSGRKPGSFNVDLRLSKDFKLVGYRYSVFLNVYNILDRLNENDVYSDTGRASYSLEEERRVATYGDEGGVTNVNSVREYFRRPQYYDAPRRVQIGLSMDF